jgi:hypothetical protein
MAFSYEEPVMTYRRPLLILVAAAALGVATAHAQTPAAAAPAAGDANVAKPNCPKPGDVPGSLASDGQRRTWQRDYTTWGDCMKKFINDQRALAEPYNKASNAAIDDYNNTVKLYNDQIEKAKEK